MTYRATRFNALSEIFQKFCQFIQESKQAFPETMETPEHPYSFTFTRAHTITVIGKNGAVTKHEFSPGDTYNPHQFGYGIGKDLWERGIVQYFNPLTNSTF